MERPTCRPPLHGILLLAALLLPLAGCGQAEEPSTAATPLEGEAADVDEAIAEEVVEGGDEPELPPPGPDDLFRVEAKRALRPAEARLVEALRARAPSAESGRMDVVTVADEPVVLPPEGQLDLQWGNGHGAHLVFTRFELRRGEVQIEQATFQGRTMRRQDPPFATVRRATVAREALEPALDLVAALGSLTVERRSRPGVLGATFGSSSRDFYVLVRCLDGEGQARVERHFVGYAGSTSEPRYAGLQVVRDTVREALDGITTWEAIPVGAHRTCHVTEAFADNRAVMIGDFAWWVQEDSLEWLALVGNLEAIPTLTWLRENDPEPHRRRTKKIDALLADPIRWLEGPPQDLESVE